MNAWIIPTLLPNYKTIGQTQYCNVTKEQVNTVYYTDMYVYL